MKQSYAIEIEYYEITYRKENLPLWKFWQKPKTIMGKKLKSHVIYFEVDPAEHKIAINQLICFLHSDLAREIIEQNDIAEVKINDLGHVHDVLNFTTLDEK